MVRTGADGSVFYENKKSSAERAGAASENAVTLPADTISNDTISQDKPVVNTNISENSENVYTSKRMVKNADTDWKITVDDTIVKDTLIHADKDKPYAKRLLSQIDAVLERSMLLDTAVSDASGKNKKGSTTFMHYFYAVVEYNGNPFLAKIAVEEYNIDSKKRAYNVERIKMSALSRTQYSAIKASYRGNLASNADGISVADLFALVKQYDKKFQPKPVNPSLLNEDGTPKLMYHGTPNGNFTIYKN